MSQQWPPESLPGGEKLAGFAKELKTRDRAESACQLALYIDVPGASNVLAHVVGQADSDALLRPQPGEGKLQRAFFAGLTCGRFSKLLQLQFREDLPKAKLQVFFQDWLDGNTGSDFQALVSQLPEPLRQEDVLSLLFAPDGESMSMDLPKRLQRTPVKLQSPATWLALQRAHLDWQDPCPELQADITRRLPKLLFEPEADAPRRSQTWREFAGRKEGKDGYELFDIHRGLLAKLGMRKPPEAPAKASAEDAKEAKHCLETVYLQEIAHLRSELEQLHAASEKALSRRWRWVCVGIVMGVLLCKIGLSALAAFNLEPPSVCGLESTELPS